MYAGKTTALVSAIQDERANQSKVFVIKKKGDDRYGSNKV
jgi:thymidine kinase